MSHAPSNSPVFANSFSGISGSVTGEQMQQFEVRTVSLPEADLLLDSSGRWAVRLEALTPGTARMLLQMLRDLAPPATQVDSAFIRQVAELDRAAQQDPQLTGEIDRGVAALDALARKLTRRSYVEVEERTLRRTLLSQIGNQPLMDRLGVRQPSPVSAAI